MTILDTRNISDKLRQQVLKRDGNQCRYCGSKTGPFHLDHVYPYSKGGETTIKNLVTACEKCNLKKRDTVGMWPKPIGYFNQKHHSPLITIITLFGIGILMNGVLFLARGMNGPGRIFILIGMVVSILSVTWNLTRR